MRKQLDKKGQVFSQMQGLMVGLASVMIIAVVVFLIIGQGRDQVISIEGGGYCGEGFSFNETGRNCFNNTNASGADGPSGLSAAFNATSTLEGSTEDAIGFIPLIVIAAIGAVLLGLVALFRRTQ